MAYCFPDRSKQVKWYPFSDPFVSWQTLTPSFVGNIESKRNANSQQSMAIAKNDNTLLYLQEPHFIHLIGGKHHTHCQLPFSFESHPYVDANFDFDANSFARRNSDYCSCD